MAEIMPFHLYVYRFPDGGTGIDSRVFVHLSAWLNHDEVVDLCHSLSDRHVVVFDQLIRERVRSFEQVVHRAA